MIFLKKVNLEDVEKEFLFITDLPVNENGFTNSYHGVSKEEFCAKTIYQIINHSEGKDLPTGYVPETYFFLWDEDSIVGLFRIRHFLNDFLKNGAYLHHSDDREHYTRIKIR